ncbi:DHA2 family efflux MFS transporter permease subunit [Kitasatospora sp. NPDC048365]|uniref:DHA2 family efflux MFS transporter permease subunit n=1 Tax=Kitasatospora sp. NPDC048365 TaxID=3364050 RepID=UPI00371CC72B
MSAAPDPRRWWVLVTVSLAQFMVALDGTVVNVMAPQVQRELGLSTTGLQWVANLYVLLFGGLLLLGGRLADQLGRRRMFLAGIVLFTLGSVLAGTADGSGQLLAARALQGVAAAAVSPAVLSILVTSFPDPGERAKAFGVWGTVLGIGASVGAILGGAIVEIGWRWAFYLNVPVGVALVAGALLLVGAHRPEPGKRPPLDGAGAVTATLGLTSLVYGIVSTTDHGWTHPLTLGAFAAAAVLLPLFARIELSSAAPLVDPRLLRRRSVLAGGLGELLTGGLSLPCFFLLPLYMQDVLGYSPLRTGLAYIPTCLAMMVVAPVLPKLLERTGPRAAYVGGTALLVVMLVVLVSVGTHASYWTTLLPITALLGVGLVGCLITTPVVGTAEATEADAGTVSALLNVSSQIGGALGLAVAVTAVQHRTTALAGRGVAADEALTGGLHLGAATLFGWMALSLLLGFTAFRGRPAAAPVAEAEEKEPVRV